MNTTATRQLVSVKNTTKGQRVTAITGSPKTNNLEYREGTVTDFAARTLSNRTHYVLEAVVTLDSGEIVRTHRLMETDTVAPEVATETHTCNETEERKAYTQYISDGLADTDGYYAPESFEAFQTHYHRSVGHVVPRTAECTRTECNAPHGEKVKMINRSKGEMRRTGLPRFESLCVSCYDAR